MAHLNHIHIKVQDARAAAQWFVDNFGNKRLDEFQAGEDLIVRTILDGVYINFTQHANAKRLPPGYAGVHLGLEHIGLMVDNLDTTLAKLRAQGVEVVEPPHASGQVNVRYAFISGPDATRIEVMERTQQEGLRKQ